ncbi:MAG: alpha/beta hydrolase [Pseudomonadales bacterium]
MPLSQPGNPTLHIDGPAGRLTARYDAVAVACTAQAVLCHPHPQYGGSMDDAVLATVAERLLAAGIGVLRFNFRGVGGSDGTYDGGDGEVADLLAATAWLRREQATGPLWAGGYSFGAWVTWRALAAGLQADRILLIAPPVGAMTFAAGPLPDIAFAIAGDADDFVDGAALQALPGVDTTIIAGCDHFFSGAHEELAAAVDRVLNDQA